MYILAASMSFSFDADFNGHVDFMTRKWFPHYWSFWNGHLCKALMFPLLVASIVLNMRMSRRAYAMLVLLILCHEESCVPPLWLFLTIPNSVCCLTAQLICVSLYTFGQCTVLIRQPKFVWHNQYTIYDIIVFDEWLLRVCVTKRKIIDREQYCLSWKSVSYTPRYIRQTNSACHQVFVPIYLVSISIA